jgi:hypothetical protein
MIKEFTPAETFYWLDAYRSPGVALPNGTWRELNMISSMGNGYTFALQTILFCCCVSAVYRSLGIELERNSGSCPGNFAVFGDDIIVVKEAYPRLVRLLNILGHEVNAEKSFSEGPFRESCGTDWFNGFYVRPVYLKRATSQQDLCIVANRLNHWSSMTGIPLKNTIRYLLKHTNKAVRVPMMENDDSGFKVPFRLLPLQERCFDENGAVHYHRYQPKGQNMVFYEDGYIIVPDGVKSRLYNAPGHLLSALAGYCDGHGSSLLNDTIGLRQHITRYRRTSNVCPSWDSVAPEPGYLAKARQASLVEATLRNVAETALGVRI